MMGIFRQPPKNKLYSVDLDSLMLLCKNDAEREALFNAIAEMEASGEAKMTFNTKIRTMTFENALIGAGLSQETVESVMEQGNLSGLIADAGTKMAEAYLNENLKAGYYVEKAEVNKVIQQFNEDVQGVMSEDQVRARFEASMESVCSFARKFDSNELAEMQISAGKNGRNFEIYRKDRHEGLCITDVPKAVIAANKEEMVAELKEQVRKAASASSREVSKAGSGAKQFANGDAENMTKGTLQVTMAAALFIFDKFVENAKKKALENAIKQGDVDINDTIKTLLTLEKKEMTKGIENDMEGVVLENVEDIMDDLDDKGLFE